jgi:transketolase
MTKLKIRDIPTLTEQARQVRIDIVQMLHESGSGHPGGSLSATDLMVALFFGK